MRKKKWWYNPNLTHQTHSAKIKTIIKMKAKQNLERNTILLIKYVDWMNDDAVKEQK